VALGLPIAEAYLAKGGTGNVRWNLPITTPKGQAALFRLSARLPAPRKGVPLRTEKLHYVVHSGGYPADVEVDIAPSNDVVLGTFALETGAYVELIVKGEGSGDTAVSLIDVDTARGIIVGATYPTVTDAMGPWTRHTEWYDSFFGLPPGQSGELDCPLPVPADGHYAIQLWHAAAPERGKAQPRQPSSKYRVKIESGSGETSMFTVTRMHFGVQEPIGEFDLTPKARLHLIADPKSAKWTFLGAIVVYKP
jgi:hypothetical protein